MQNYAISLDFRVKYQSCIVNFVSFPCYKALIQPKKQFSKENGTPLCQTHRGHFANLPRSFRQLIAVTSPTHRSHFPVTLKNSYVLAVSHSSWQNG